MAIALLLTGLLAGPAMAAATISSPGPDAVSISVYRNSGRPPSVGIDAEATSLQGYALVTETRTVDLPRGPVTIRFEGVASGIQPESAIVSGIAAREKNQDRLLLSGPALIDAFTGQEVILRRTDPRSGKMTEEPARIRSGANGVVVETVSGFEALKCSGLAETILYPRVPQGVSAKPVLSVTTGDQPGGRRQLTLSYLSGNFDWQANYVAELAPDAASLSLFAWVTLASRDDTSFTNARANAIAGRVAREEGDDGDQRRNLYYRPIAQCWPNAGAGAPSEIIVYARRAEGFGGGDEIIVTGSRVHREELGDLKLYRIAFPVTLAARSQKQVAFLARPRVRGELLYRSEIYSSDDGDEPRLLFRLRNRKEQGLGEPLPAGQVILFQKSGDDRLLLGESSTADKAVGEEVEFVFGEASNIKVENEEFDDGSNWSRHRLTVANANPFAIIYEARFRDDPSARFDGFGGKLARIDGRWVWRVRIPANSRASLIYRETELDG